MKLPDNLGNKLLFGAGVAATLCTPVATGFVVARNLIEAEHFLPPVALTAAASLELLGFMAATVGLAHREIDARQGKRLGTLPTWLAVMGLFAYVGIAMGLVRLVENSDVLIMFPPLSLVASLTLALVQELGRRQQSVKADAHQIEQARQAEQAARMESLRLEGERQAERDRLAAERTARLDQAAHEEKLATIEARKQAKIAKLQSAGNTVTPTGNNAGNTVTPQATPTGNTVTPQDRREALRGLMGDGNKPNISELSRLWGVSRKTIYDDIELITNNGNGNGSATK